MASMMPLLHPKVPLLVQACHWEHLEAILW